MATHSFEGVWSGNKTGIFGLLAWGRSIVWLAHLLAVSQRRRTRYSSLELSLNSSRTSHMDTLTLAIDCTTKKWMQHKNGGISMTVWPEIISDLAKLCLCT